MLCEADQPQTQPDVEGLCSMVLVALGGSGQHVAVVAAVAVEVVRKVDACFLVDLSQCCRNQAGNYLPWLRNLWYNGRKIKQIKTMYLQQYAEIFHFVR